MLGRLGGLVFKRASRQALLPDLTPKLEDWLYEVRWRQQPHAGPVRPADFLPDAATLADRVQPLAAQLTREAGLDATAGAALVADLEQLSRQYTAQALRLLGWSPGAEEILDADSLASRLGILPVHQKLVGRLLEILGRGRLLPGDPQQLHHELLDRYPHHQVELTLLGRCGEQLAGVLTGQVDPLGLLFPSQGVRADDLYRDAPAAQVFNGLVRQSVQEALATLPPNRHLRVLEIGAGTGGTTGFVLPVLPVGRTDYNYTDLSAGFFDAAAARFRSYPFVQYRALDIEREPAGQGFGRHRYDVVLAANVLHATRDIGQTLAHVRQLLAPGGLLVLLEGLGKLAWVDLTFGLLAGWWRFQDGFRPDYPLLNLERWTQLLQEQGFGVAAAVAPEGMTQQAVLLARGPAEVEVTPEPAGTWLILSDRHGLGVRLAEQLARRQQQCVLAEPGEDYAAVGEGRYQVPPGEAPCWERLLDEGLAGGPPLRGVVHLWGLEAAAAEATTAATLAGDTRQSCGSVLALVQALARSERQPSAGLWLLTRGAQVTEGQRQACPAQAALWGLGKVVALEHPELNCRLLDLDPDLPAGPTGPTG